MASNVNVWTGQLRATGVQVRTAQYELHIRYEWQRQRTALATETATAQAGVLWPDILEQCDRAWVEERIQELMLEAMRHVSEVDKPSPASVEAG